MGNFRGSQSKSLWGSCEFISMYVVLVIGKRWNQSAQSVVAGGKMDIVHLLSGQITKEDLHHWSSAETSTSTVHSS